MNPGSQTPSPGDPVGPYPENEAGQGRRRLELPDSAKELLAIAGHITADDGPLQPAPDPGALSPWHERALLESLERLEVIDHYLRGRVAFFVAGKDHGYGPFEGELELARVALDNCRATAKVVDALLARRLPADREYETMGATTERLYAALKALNDRE